MNLSNPDLISRPIYGVVLGLSVLFSFGLASLAQTVQPMFADYYGPYLGQKPPGATAEIFAPGLFSDDDFPHGSPVFTPDGNEIILPGIKIMRNIEGRWTRPENAPFCGSLRGANPTLSPDGMMLLFLSPYQGPERPSPGTYVVTRTGQTWNPAVLIDPAVNSLPRGWEISISSRRNLYFASGAIEGGFGSSDLYECELIAGQYSAPRNLGGGVNTRHGESSVYISPDEDYLVFSSTGPESLGKDDLYISFHGQDGSWGRGINLGPRINTAGTETWPNITTDGKYLFFIRAQRGRADIFWASTQFVADLKPENVRRR